MSDLWIHSEGAAVTLWLTQEHKCLQCKKRFEDPWLVPTGRAWPDNVVLNAEVAWHWQDTHGFDAESLAELVSASMYNRREMAWDG